MPEPKLLPQSMDFAVSVIHLVKHLKSQRESIISNQIGRSGTAYHDRQTGFGFEGVDLNRTCCGLCAALQFLSCLFGGRGCPVILCC